MSIRGLIIGILTALCLLVMPSGAQSFLIVVDEHSSNVTPVASSPMNEATPDLVFDGALTLRFQMTPGTNKMYSLVSEGDDLDLQRVLLYKMSGFVIRPDSTIDETFITYRFYTLEESFELNTNELSVVNARLFVSGQDYNWKEVYDSTKSSTSTSRKKTNDDDFHPVEREPEFDGKRTGALVQYPEIARRAGIEGQVMVAALINDRGLVIEAVITASDNALLNASAMRAVILTEFTPGTVNGKPIKTWVRIPILFKLK